MKLFFKNGVYASLSLSRIFNTLGGSIFNIVFVVFASSMPNPKFAIAVANFIVLVPTFFTIFAGIKADKTVHKARWLIHFGYLQALLFVLVAFMTRSSSYLAFSAVCLMNLLSEELFSQKLPLGHGSICDGLGRGWWRIGERSRR